MAVATRPPNLVHRVLDPGGSLGGEPLELTATVALVAGVASSILLAGRFGRFAMAPVFLCIAAAYWRNKLVLKLGLPVDDTSPRWFDMALIGIALTFLTVLLVCDEHSMKLLAGILFGSILPFTFVVSTRQISQQAAKRLS